MSAEPGREPTHHTATVRGATLAYDVRGDLADCTAGNPPLLLFGSPMDSTGFTTLAGHFPDRVVVTYDPRNTGRSQVGDTGAAVTVEQHADDLHALVENLGVGPVDMFGTSGGATNALVNATRHPDDVRVLVAHEPPVAAALPDLAGIAQATSDIVATYDDSGEGPAMARFIRLVMHLGPVDDAYLAAPPPDPAMFGLPTEDDGGRGNPLIGNLRGGGVEHPLDLEALRQVAPRVLVAVGEESGGPQDGGLAARAGYAVAAALGLEPVVLPGGHDGFLGGEHGRTGRPDEFGAALRSVLAEAVDRTAAGSGR
jgi:pimeloyl-ACP methyl ester carboxylesterase